MSEPDALSSQDWGELLSSAGSSAVSTAGSVSQVSSAVSSTPTGKGGGFSWLLVLGIALIVLGLAGIGYFVYAQFISKNRGGRGGHGDPMNISSHGPKSGSPKDDTQPLEFEDISSNSASVKKPLEGVRPAGTINRKPTPPKAAQTPRPAKSVPTVGEKDATIPIPQPKPAPAPAAKPAVSPQPAVRTPAPAPAPQKADSPKAQATPVQESNFDWEKFFDEEDR